MQLAEKVALVTGAGSGIGRAAAILLAKEGARVGALGRTAEELQEVVAEIEGAGGQALALVADVSDPGQMEGAVQQLGGAGAASTSSSPTPASTASGRRWTRSRRRSGTIRWTST